MRPRRRGKRERPEAARKERIEMAREDRPHDGGGREVDHSVGNARKVRAADENVTPTKGHNLVIWIFIALLVAAIVLVVVGAITR